MFMRSALICLSLLATLLMVIAAAPFVIGDLETKELTPELRASMAGETFAKLSDGITHYIWKGPEDAPVVVLVHGFSTPAWVWEHQVPALVDSGHRVLTYDLYGRGYSDRLSIPYEAELYDRQLMELLDTLNVTKPVDIVGLSMGGAITINFCDKHSERVRRFALIAPAGFGAAVPGVAQLLNVPGLGAWAMKAFGDRMLLGQIGKFLAVRPELGPMVQERYRDQMQYKGYKFALRSTLINMTLDGMQDTYKRVGARDIPSALFWGTNDTIVPYALHEEALKNLPGVQFHSINGAGHGVNLEQPEAINPALVAFFKENPGN